MNIVITFIGDRVEAGRVLEDSPVYRAPFSSISWYHRILIEGLIHGSLQDSSTRSNW